MNHQEASPPNTSTPLALLVLASVWGGALAGRHVPTIMPLAALGPVLLVTARMAWRRRHTPAMGAGTVVGCLLCAVVVSMTGAALRTAGVDHGPFATMATVGYSGTATGVVVVAELTPIRDVRTGPHGQQQVLARLAWIDRPGGRSPTATRERVLVNLRRDGGSPQQIQVGASYAVSGLAGRIEGPAADWARSLGVVATIEPRRLSMIRAPTALQRGANHLRRRTAAAAAAGLPPASASLLTGLVTGDLTGQPEEVEDQVRRAGLSHLVAVSGSNVALVIAATLTIGRLVNLGRRQTWWASLGVVWWFVMVVRAEPSVLRAAMMATLLITARLIGRRVSTLHLLGMAGSVVLLADPFLAGRLGFALSMAATAGVLVLTPRVQGKLPSWIPGSVRMVIGATCGAQLAVAPLILVSSGELHPAVVPANLIAVPAAAVASLMGGAMSAVSLGSVPLAGLVARAATPALATILLAARWFASPSGRDAAMTGAVAIVVVGLSARLLRPMGGRRLPVKLPVVATVVLVLLVVTGSWPGRLTPALPATPVLIALDVGQGDALLLGDPAQGWVLVDGGPDPARLERELAAVGVTTLDTIIATHADADHVAGLESPLSDLDVGRLLIGPRGKEASTMLDAADAAGIPVQPVARGDHWQHGVFAIDVLSPPATGLGLDRNDNSLVLRVDVADGPSLLLTGDVQALGQQVLLDGARDDGPGEGIDVDILKVPHHGGATNTPGFLAATTPELALISVGEHNTFGHPRPEVLAELSGIETHRTDLEGRVRIDLGTADGSVAASS